jgi:DNA-binding NarL/FixJ family response regulator
MTSGIRDDECFTYVGKADSTQEKRCEGASGYSVGGVFKTPGAYRAESHGTGIVLIDPQPRTRALISHLLSGDSSAKRRSEDLTVWPVASFEEFLLAPLREGKAALIVLNRGALCPFDEEARVDYTRLRNEFPGVPIVVLSDCLNPKHILGALRNGVRGYIPSALPSPMVIQVIRLVLAGGTFIPPSVLANPEESAGGTFMPVPENRELACEFTPRQTEVFELLRQGKSNKVIAYELRMQESTVKVHVRQIMRKLKAINRTHAVFLVNRMGQGGLN